MNNNIDEKKAQAELEKGYGEAQDILKDRDKTEEFLQRIEMKLKLIPKIGGVLSMVPTMISLVRSYIRKEYQNIPAGSIVAVVSALIYFLSPIDIIPDSILGVGYIDDAFIVSACLKLVGNDIIEYQKWRKDNNKLI